MPFAGSIDRRTEFLGNGTILIGEPDALGYGALQDELGRLIHGEEDWATLRGAKDRGQGGRLGEDKIEPLVPDAIDQGEQPFVRPFMVDMADDHYDLDISPRARPARLGAKAPT